MMFIVDKKRFCPCGCGRLCKLFYVRGIFKGYSRKAPDCLNKYKRVTKQKMPDRLPVGSRRIDHIRGIPYFVIKIPGKGKWMREHRYIAETQLRPLLKKEHVHHINGNTLDNRVENLAILSHGKHTRLHHGLDQRWSIKYNNCIGCGTTHRRHISKGLCVSCYQKSYRLIHGDKLRAKDRMRWANHLH